MFIRQQPSKKPNSATFNLGNKFRLPQCSTAVCCKSELIFKYSYQKVCINLLKQMIKSKQLIQMRGARLIKKSQTLMRTVESQSRQIISNSDGDKLQFSQNENCWMISPLNLKVVEQQTPAIHQQPLQHLLPLLEHLAKGFYVDICSFILAASNTIFAVTQEKHITVSKHRKEKGKLRYWLSHIYFNKLRSKLAEQLLANNQAYIQGHRQVVHDIEEKQYMPSVCSGKRRTSAVVRKIKVSSEPMYSKQGALERQPFCVGYFLNGAQQLFSFTEILSFIQYPFNIEELSYLKILAPQKDGVESITTIYSKSNETIDKKLLIEKFKRIIKKEERWRYLQDECEEERNRMIKNNQYEAYVQLLTLEIISFLETSQHIEVLQLKLSWIIDSQNHARLSNCFSYKFTSINTLALTTPEGLIGLYEKRFMDQSQNDQREGEKVFRVKKIKSQEKYNMEHSLRLPKSTCKYPMRKSLLFECNSSMRSRGKGSTFRKRLNKQCLL